MPVLTYEPTWSTYEVPGHTLEEAARHIEQAAEAGHTHWMPQYHVQEWEGQTIKRVQVDVYVEISMPHWSGYDAATPAEKAEWDRFYAALQTHEQGHIDLVRSYTENADVMMEGLDEHGAAQKWQENLQALQQASDQYDTGNDHGRNAGTTITPPESEAAEGEQEESVTP
jgi:predicted secreted Zn-dependent protease